LGKGDRSQKTLMKIKCNVTIKYFCEAYMVVEFLLIFFLGVTYPGQAKVTKAFAFLTLSKKPVGHVFRFFLHKILRRLNKLKSLLISYK